MMKIDMNRTIENLNGDEMQTNGGAEGEQKPLELGELAVNALISDASTEEPKPGRAPMPPSPKEKFERYLIAQRIHKVTDLVELTSEEVTLIKNLIGKCHGVVIMGHAWKLLEGGDG